MRITDARLRWAALVLGGAALLPAIANATIHSSVTSSSRSEVDAQLGMRPRARAGLLTPMGEVPIRLRHDTATSDPSTLGSSALGRSTATSAVPEPGVGRAVESGPAVTARDQGTAALTPRAPDEQQGTQHFAFALSSGCTQLTAVGTPAVRNVALRVTDPAGQVRVFDARSGRSESATLCPRDDGEYGVEVVTRAARHGIVDTQLFVERQPEVSAREP